MENIEKRQVDIFHKIFEYYNSELFSGKLLKPIILLDYNIRHAMGFAGNKRIVDIENAVEMHTLGLNPDYFDDRLELCQTIVHEMCHLWEYQAHPKEDRKTSHTKLWADKMESLGLMPSHTGKPGGRRTGRNVTDYPIDGGLFETVTRQLFRQQNEFEILLGKPKMVPKKKNTRTKYVCPLCKITVYGRTELLFLCGVCMQVMEEYTNA